MWDWNSANGNDIREDVTLKEMKRLLSSTVEYEVDQSYQTRRNHLRKKYS